MGVASNCPAPTTPHHPGLPCPVRPAGPLACPANLVSCSTSRGEPDPYSCPNADREVKTTRLPSVSRQNPLVLKRDVSPIESLSVKQFRPSSHSARSDQVIQHSFLDRPPQPVRASSVRNNCTQCSKHRYDRSNRLKRTHRSFWPELCDRHILRSVQDQS